MELFISMISLFSLDLALLYISMQNVIAMVILCRFIIYLFSQKNHERSKIWKSNITKGATIQYPGGGGWSFWRGQINYFNPARRRPENFKFYYMFI